MLTATVGACLSLKRGEFAQELERISACNDPKTQHVTGNVFRHPLYMEKNNTLAEQEHWELPEKIYDK